MTESRIRRDTSMQPHDLESWALSLDHSASFYHWGSLTTIIYEMSFWSVFLKSFKQQKQTIIIF